MQECEQKRHSKLDAEEVEAVHATQHLSSLQEKIIIRSHVAEQRLKDI
jgi:hypothetical protein